MQTHAWTIEHRAGTPQGNLFIEDIKHLYRLLLPFLLKWIHVPADYDTIYNQALTEMQRPDFVATMNLLTASGTKGDY